ncbi:hypothetical protein F0L74_23930 [Chitinophaga agrisoli]|uniref:Uncharacterized protein n=1 Tax=Chitinophaga agrisoli TaxID=2607653 RepID=A0A5B2VM25_9BACT|nr:hypothetical protein [Chitinophaga agrisoli]KAA2239259.1 hypothetical protein F0L74_23930 [Chitinophaga agrisoli]
MSKHKMLLSLLLTLSTLLPLHARAQGNDADTIRQELLHTLHALPAFSYPYGSPILLKQFPQQWHNVTPTGTPYYLTTYIDTLSIFTYQDFSTGGRYAVPLKELPRDGVFPPQFLHKLGLKPIGDTASLMIRKITETAGVTIYSAIVLEDIPCPACEYKPQQLINMLFTVSGNKIISRLVITYINGDDLQRKERYGYIDGQGNIFIKDFFSDELDGHFLKQERWHVTSEGIFGKDQ